MVVTTYILAASMEGPPCKGCHINKLYYSMEYSERHMVVTTYILAAGVEGLYCLRFHFNTLWYSKEKYSAELTYLQGSRVQPIYCQQEWSFLLVKYVTLTYYNIARRSIVQRWPAYGGHDLYTGSKCGETSL